MKIQASEEKAEEHQDEGDDDDDDDEKMTQIDTDKKEKPHWRTRVFGMGKQYSKITY